MPTDISSKHTNKEGRPTKKKSNKSSSKRRRLSHHSSSSPDRKEDSRARRKSSRRDTKKRRRSSGDQKRRKDSKKTVAKKLRSRPDTSSGDSSRSCSTCRGRSSSSGRSRSPSPARKEKPRVRGRSSGRDRSRRSRYRTPSRSTCSENNSSPIRSPRENESKDKKGSVRHPRTKPLDDDRGKIPSRSSDSLPVQSNNGDGYDVGRWMENKGQAEEAADVKKDALNDRGEDDPYKKGQVISSKANNSRSAKKANDGSDDSRQLKFGLTEELSARNNSVVVVNSLHAGNSDDGCNDTIRLESGSGRDRSARNTDVVASIGISEAADLEMILRQKALENFTKFRGGLSAGLKSVGDGKVETARSESCKDVGHGSAKGYVKSIESKPANSLDNHRHTQCGGRPIKAGAKSVSNPVARVPDDNVTSKLAGDLKISSSSNNRSTQNQVKSVQESSSKISSEQSSLPKDIQGKKAVAESKSGNIHGTEANIADRSVLGTSCLDMKSGNCKSNESVVEAKSGAQFEQKTFSRMHDGEVVQVSYKVYIPKKSPAFTRKQSQ